ncbi:hypothetical protein DFH06DRAFT_1123674 [Mycena polygramma]|nr:hypothetical protein DFH06DRAFT_1123674 [Mycena polygramma]
MCKIAGKVFRLVNLVMCSDTGLPGLIPWLRPLRVQLLEHGARSGLATPCKGTDNLVSALQGNNKLATLYKGITICFADRTRHAEPRKGIPNFPPFGDAVDFPRFAPLCPQRMVGLGEQAKKKDEFSDEFGALRKSNFPHRSTYSHIVIGFPRLRDHSARVCEKGKCCWKPEGAELTTTIHTCGVPTTVIAVALKTAL